MRKNKLNWSKKDAQNYGVFMALLGFLLGLLISYIMYK